MSVDILNLEWNDVGRDREIITPIQYYLEKIAGLKVKNVPIWDLRSIDEYRPRLVLMANADGDSANTTVLHYCRSRKVAVAHLMSEGVFPQSFVSSGQFWGWNSEHICGNLWLVWSERLAGWKISHSPQIKDNVRISGAVGFDRYSYGQTISKAEFLVEIGRANADKLVGIAGYGMNVARGVTLPSTPLAEVKAFDERIERDKPLFNKELKNLVQSCPQILFVLKPHPAERNLPPEDSEFAGLEAFSNVYMARFDAPIGDILSVCDIWLGYESTTALESWCLDEQRPVLFLNPSKADFPRSDICHGVLIAKTGAELADYIQEFYSKGQIAAYTALEAKRQTIIKNIIGWNDGLNHVRAAKAIVELFNNLPLYDYKNVYDLQYLKALYRRFAIKTTKYWPSCPVLKRFAFVHNLFKPAQMDKLMRKRYAELDDFYVDKQSVIYNLKPALPCKAD